MWSGQTYVHFPAAQILCGNGAFNVLIDLGLGATGGRFDTGRHSTHNSFLSTSSSRASHVRKASSKSHATSFSTVSGYGSSKRCRICVVIGLGQFIKSVKEGKSRELRCSITGRSEKCFSENRTICHPRGLCNDNKLAFMPIRCLSDRQYIKLRLDQRYQSWTEPFICSSILRFVQGSGTHLD